MVTITSKQNDKIKQISALLGSKKARAEQSLFVAEGVRVCAEALTHGAAKSLYATEQGYKKLCDFIGKTPDTDSVIISDDVATKLGDTVTTQGVFALCATDYHKPIEHLSAGQGAILLSSLGDPGNVGSVIRSCKAFSLPLILSGDCADIYSPKVIRSSMGGIFRSDIYVGGDTAKIIDHLKSLGTAVYAAALTSDAVNLTDSSVKLRTAVVAIGNEGHGLSDDVISRCDKSVIIPISEDSESLNAAVAASIFAWEISKVGGVTC